MLSSNNQQNLFLTVVIRTCNERVTKARDTFNDEGTQFSFKHHSDTYTFPLITLFPGSLEKCYNRLPLYMLMHTLQTLYKIHLLTASLTIKIMLHYGKISMV